MNPQKQKIREYAKDLFLQVDENGSKKYSLREICTKIAQKHKKDIAPNTIRNWSEAEHWISIYEKSKQAGIEQSKIEADKKENALIDAKANDIAEIYKRKKEQAELAAKHIKAKLTGQKLNGEELDLSGVPFRDLLTLQKDAEQTILNLNDKPTHNDNSVHIIIDSTSE